MLGEPVGGVGIFVYAGVEQVFVVASWVLKHRIFQYVVILVRVKDDNKFPKRAGCKLVVAVNESDVFAFGSVKPVVARV